MTNLRRIFQILRQSTCRFPQHPGDYAPVASVITEQAERRRTSPYAEAKSVIASANIQHFLKKNAKIVEKFCLLLFCKPLAGTGTLESQSPRFSFSQMLPRCELNLGCTALCASHHAITLQKYNKYSEYFGPIWSFFIWRTKKRVCQNRHILFFLFCIEAFR